MATHPNILTEKPMDRGVQRDTIHGIPKSQTDCVTNNFTFFQDLFKVKISKHSNRCHDLFFLISEEN